MDENIYLLFIVIVLMIIYKNIKKIYIPRIIWTYWDNVDTMPELVKDIVINRQEKLKDYTQYFISDKTIHQWIKPDEYPKNYNSLIKAHKADWIRLYLLKKHGGIWIDCGIIINSVDELNKIYKTSNDNKDELTCFYLDGLCIDNDPTTFIENWFIMAPKNSRLINKWYDEFTYAIEIGFMEYKFELLNMNIKVSQVYMYGDDDVYLTMHAAIQKILQLKMVDNPRIKLYKAEDAMYKIQVDCNWDELCITDILKTKKIKTIPFIKLRGTDRSNISTIDL